MNEFEKRPTDDELILGFYKGEHYGYDLVGITRGHEIILYESYGSYQGEWIFISKKEDKGYIWSGYFGSCSGCDDYEAHFDSYNKPTPDHIWDFVKNYTPFMILPLKDLIKYSQEGLLKDLIVPKYQEYYGEIDYESFCSALQKKLEEGNDRL